MIIVKSEVKERMKSRKRILTGLLAAGLMGASMVPSGVASALADIKSLDFRFNGSSLSCFEREAGWSDDEYLIHYGEYIIMNMEGYETVGEAREYGKTAISSNFDSFYVAIFRDYASVHYEDFGTNEAYYATYHEEMMETYLSVLFRDVAVSILGDEEVENYDIVANYCADDATNIATTYAWDGFTGYVRLNGTEITLDRQDLTFLGDGFGYHLDGFGDVKVRLERINATTLKANYVLTNLTGEEAEYGLAFYGDVEFGENDDAAIARTEDSFTIIQDRATPGLGFDFSKTFGAKFHIQLDPMPTTTYVGDYDDAREFHWENSNYVAFSAVNDIDTGLAYSWQGTIGDGETKEFSATYFIELEDGYYSNKFYYLSNEYAEPLDEIDAINGLSLKLPGLSDSVRKGYHRAWNTKADGTGVSYEGSDVILADENVKNFYEVEKKNQLVSLTYTGWGKVHESGLVLSDAVRDKYNALLDDVYSDIEVGIAVGDDDDELKGYIEEGSFDEGKIKEIAGGEDYVPVTMIYMEGPYVSYVGEDDGTTFYEDLDDFMPVSVRMKMDEYFAKGKANFSVVRVKCGKETDDSEFGCGNYEKIPTTYDSKTGELVMEYDGKSWEDDGDGYYSYSYVLAYTEIPNVPNTGKVGSVVAATMMGVPAAIVAMYVTKRSRR